MTKVMWKRNRNNDPTEIERFDWFIERIQTRVAFGWLSERSGEKTSCPRTFWKSIDSSLLRRHTATRLANRTMLSPYGFLWRENEVFMFWSFHLLIDKTNNENRSNASFFSWQSFDRKPIGRRRTLRLGMEKICTTYLSSQSISFFFRFSTPNTFGMTATTYRNFPTSAKKKRSRWSSFEIIWFSDLKWVL